MVLSIKRLFIITVAFFVLAIFTGPGTALAQIINAGSSSGTIFSCEGTPSYDPNIGHFTVSGSGLSADISLNASANFEISLNSASGYVTSLSLPQSAGSVGNTTIYVRSAASAPPGITPGTITATSGAATPKTVNVNARINPLPTVNQVNSIVKKNGQTVPAINFTGTGRGFTWTNDQPGIGLAASGSGNIPSFTAINPGLNTVTATITVTPISPGYVYISDNSGNNVYIVNTLTNLLETVVNVTFPGLVHASPNGSQVFVEDYASNIIPVISTSSNTITHTITLPGSTNSNSILISRDGSTLYSGGSNNTLYVIDIASYRIIRKIAIPTNGPVGLSPDGTKIYVIDNLAHTSYSIFDTQTGALIASVPLPPFTDIASPGNFVLSEDGTEFYITAGPNTVMVIDAATGAFITNITVGNTPRYITFSPDGAHAYVANYTDHSVSVINTATNTVESTIQLTDISGGMVVGPSSARLYAINGIAHTLDEIGLVNSQIFASVPAGPHPVYPDVAGGTGCSGAPITFTISVESTVNAIITPGAVSGAIAACAGSPSASPNIQQFKVSGRGLIADITATAPPNFEISTAPDIGYSNNLTLVQNGGAVNNVTVYVRAAATAPVGNISGNVKLSTPGGPDKNVAVSGTVTAALNPSVTISADQTSICQGTQVNFTAVASGAGASPVYQWSVNGTNTGTNAATFSTSTLNNGDNVICTVITNTICGNASAVSNQVGITVTPYSTPIISVTASTSNPVCSGIPLAFTATLTNGGDAPSYQWQVNNVNAGTNSAVFTAGALNNGDQVTCTTTNNGVCALPATSPPYTVVVNQSPTVTFSQNVTIAEGSSIQLNPIITGDVTSYSWSPANGLDNSGVANPMASPVSTTLYQLTVTSADGCGATNDITVTVVKPPLVIPTTFTPNGDGINDTWNIKYLDTYPGCSIKIFTRNGGLIYQSTGYPKPWDGTYNQEPLPIGVYYYVIDLKDGAQPLGGSVTILR